MGRALEGRDEYEGTSCEIEKRAIGMANISMIGRCKKVDSFLFTVNVVERSVLFLTLGTGLCYCDMYHKSTKHMYNPSHVSKTA